MGGGGFPLRRSNSEVMRDRERAVSNGLLAVTHVDDAKFVRAGTTRDDFRKLVERAARLFEATYGFAVEPKEIERSPHIPGPAALGIVTVTSKLEQLVSSIIPPGTHQEARSGREPATGTEQ